MSLFLSVAQKIALMPVGSVLAMLTYSSTLRFFSEIVSSINCNNLIADSLTVAVISSLDF